MFCVIHRFLALLFKDIQDTKVRSKHNIVINIYYLPLISKMHFTKLFFEDQEILKESIKKNQDKRRIKVRRIN